MRGGRRKSCCRGESTSAAGVSLRRKLDHTFTSMPSVRSPARRSDSAPVTFYPYPHLPARSRASVPGPGHSRAFDMRVAQGRWRWPGNREIITTLERMTYHVARPCPCTPPPPTTCHSRRAVDRLSSCARHTSFVPFARGAPSVSPRANGTGGTLKLFDVYRFCRPTRTRRAHARAAVTTTIQTTMHTA